MGGAWWAVTPTQAPGAFVHVMWESGTVVYLQVGFCALVLGVPPRWFGVIVPNGRLGTLKQSLGSHDVGCWKYLIIDLMCD